MLPSEKAWAYKLKLDAMKRQAGRPRKENLSQVGTDSGSSENASQVGTHSRSDQELANQVGISRNQVQRYIRLTELLPELMDMVDAKKLALSQVGTDSGSSENASQVGTHSRSDQELANQVGISRNQVQRYIRLTELLPELMDMVDAKKLALNPAYELSFLTKEEQAILLEVIRGENISISLLQAGQLKKLSQENNLTEETVLDLLCEKKAAPIKITLQEKKIRKYFPPAYTQQQVKLSQENNLTEETVLDLLCEKKAAPIKITLQEKKIRKYFPPAYTQQQVEDVIFELLEQWSAQHKDKQQ